MTITPLWLSGMESGSSLEFSGTIGGVVATAQKKSGVYSWSTNSGGSYGYVTLPSGLRQIRIGSWFNPMATASTFEGNIIDIVNSSITQLLGVHGKGSASGNPLILDVAGTDQDTEGGANENSIWFHLGIDIKVHVSAGWTVVYKNGIEILRFEGNTGNADIFRATFGNFAVGQSVTQYWDDMYIDDTTGESAPAPLPIKTFQYLLPNAVGTYNAGDRWPDQIGGYTNRHLVVDDVPVNTSDFVEETTADKMISFNMTTYTLASNEGCVAAWPIAVCQRIGGTEQIAVGTKIGDDDSIGSDQTPSNAWAGLRERQTTKPGGGAWDQTAINAIEFLMKSRGTYS